MPTLELTPPWRLEVHLHPAHSRALSTACHPEPGVYKCRYVRLAADEEGGPQGFEVVPVAASRLAPAELRCHLGQDVLEDVGVVVHAELVRHGQ